MDRKIPESRKGRFQMQCQLVHIMVYGLETVARTEQQCRLQVCQNKWIRRIAKEKDNERTNRRNWNEGMIDREIRAG